MKIDNPGCKDIKVYRLDGNSETFQGGLNAGVTGATYYVGPGTYVIRDNDGVYLNQVTIASCSDPYVVQIGYDEPPTMILNNPGCRDIDVYEVTSSGETFRGGLNAGVTGAEYFLGNGTYSIRLDGGQLLQTVSINGCDYTHDVTVSYEEPPTMILNNPGCRDIDVYEVTSSGETFRGGLNAGVTGAEYFLGNGTYSIRLDGGQLLQTVSINGCDYTHDVTVSYDEPPTMVLDNPGCKDIDVYRVETSGETFLGKLNAGVTGAEYYLGDGTYSIRLDDTGELLQTVYINGCNNAQTITVTYDCGPCVNNGGDSDNDGVCNNQDNCIFTYNPNQSDSDGNGIGDVCDQDLQCSNTNTLVSWNFANCVVDGDYSEFQPNQVAGISATNVFRNNPNANGHSCIVSNQSDGIGLCVSSQEGCSFMDNSDLAIRFEVTVNGSSSNPFILSELRFFQKVLDLIYFTGGNTALNDYPSKYGIRVTVNGNEIFKQVDIPTSFSLDYSESSISFEGNDQFIVTSPKTFKFELLGYCRSNPTYPFEAWEVDDISIIGCSGNNTDPCASQGGDTDADGVCNDQDCQPFDPSFPAIAGTACNDGNPNTTNDVVTSDGCGCQGETSSTDPTVNYTICPGESITLTHPLNNANWYFWNDLAGNTQSITVSPQKTTHYKVTAYNGSRDSRKFVVTVEDCGNPPVAQCGEEIVYLPVQENPLVHFDFDECAGDASFNEFGANVSNNGCGNISNFNIGQTFSQNQWEVEDQNWPASQIHDCDDRFSDIDGDLGLLLSKNKYVWGSYNDLQNEYFYIEFTTTPNGTGLLTGFQMNLSLFHYWTREPQKLYIRIKQNGQEVYLNNNISLPESINYNENFHFFEGFNLPYTGTTTFRVEFNTFDHVYTGTGTPDDLAYYHTYIDDVMFYGGCGATTITPSDADNDGTCDSQDCQPFNPAFPATPGTACNDGNPNTTNDVVTSDGCGCQGTINPCASQGGDTDGDGTCDNQDCNPFNPNLPATPGTACNDGNPNTTNDVVTADGCGCQGTIPDPCASQGGDTDGDGTCDNQDCNPFNSNLPATPGTACNDGNPNTTNDVIQSDGCTCAGQIACNPILIVSNTGCKTINVILQNQTIGSIISNDQAFIDAQEGDNYFFTVGNNTIDSYTVSGCNTQNVTLNSGGCDPCNNLGGDTDGDGTCDNQDCQPFDPAFPATPGTSCNDGNPQTNNDVVQADGCSCAGTPINTGGDCEAVVVNASTSNGSIVVSNLNAPIAQIQVFDQNWQTQVNELVYNNADQTFSGLNAGTYIVFVKYYTSGWQILCEKQFTVTVSGGGNPCDNAGGDSDGDGVCDNQDCQPLDPALPATPGTACNDGNPQTQNDVIQSDGCTCAGEIDCNPIVEILNIGCETVNVILENQIIGFVPPNEQAFIDAQQGNVYVFIVGNNAIETYTVFGCNVQNVTLNSGGCDPCENLGGDSDGDGVCDNQDCEPFDSSFPATPGTSCNDGNSQTENDVVQADGCSCQGTPVNNGGDCETVSVSSSNGSIVVSNIDAPIAQVQVFDQNWQSVENELVYNNADQTFNGLNAGTYIVFVKYYTSGWQILCEKQFTVTVSGGGNPCDNAGGDSDGDGVCDNQDNCPNNANANQADSDGDGIGDACDTVDPCANQGGDSDGDGICNNQDCQPFDPSFPATPGTSCNDGNSQTENDVVQADGCSCEGTPVNNGGDCETVSVSSSNGSIVVSNIDAPIAQVQVFDQNWQTQVNELVYNNADQTFSGLSSGTYIVFVKYYTSGWQILCEKQFTVTVSGGGNPCDNAGGDSDGDGVCDNQDNCPNNANANQADSDGDGIGDACDTVDPCANQGGDSDGDGICNNQDCQPFNPSFPATPGLSCNDGDPNTQNDVIQSDGCSCAGTPIQQSCSNVVAHWDLEGCQFSNDYSGNTAVTCTPGGFNSVNASVVSHNANLNTSCPQDGAVGGGLCYFYGIGGLEFSVTLSPTNGQTATLGGFSFYEQAPLVVLNVNTGAPVTNRPPTKFRYRVLKNGQEVANQTNFNTNITNTFSGDLWVKRTIDLESLGQTVSSSTTFTIELIGYEPQNTTGTIAAWDIDEISVFACSSSSTPSDCDTVDPCANQGGDSDGDGVCDNQDNCPNNANANQADSDNDGIGDVCDNNNGGGGNGGDPCSVGSVTSTQPFTVDFEGLDAAPIVIAQLFDKYWNVTWSCTADCPASYTYTNDGEEGDCYYSVQYYTANWEPICRLEGWVYVLGNENIESGQVELFNSNVVKQDRAVRLNWVSNTGFKEDHFVIERSVDQVNFETIHEAAILDQDSNSPLYYDFKDVEPNLGENYYRVKQVFSDGTFEYSSLHRVVFDVDLGEVNLFPNPTSGNAYLSLKPFAGKKATIQVYNTLGQGLIELNVDELTEAPVLLDLSTFKNGVYSIVVNISDHKVFTKNIVISRL